MHLVELALQKFYLFFRLLALEHKNRGVNPSHPYAIGVAYGDDVWMQTLQTHTPYYNAVPDKVQEAMDLVAKVSGRQYHLFDYVGIKYNYLPIGENT